MENTGFTGLLKTLYQRVILSYKSTLIGILVIAAGQIIEHFAQSPNKIVAAIFGVLGTVFVLVKDKFPAPPADPPKVVGALLALVLPMLANAHGAAYSTYTYTGTAASGAALNSDVIDARDLESLTIVGSVATADRTITVSCLAVDGTTALFSLPAVTAAAAGQAQQMIVVRPDVTVPGTAPTGVTYYNVSLCPKMQVVMASAAGTATLNIIGRRQQAAATVSRCPDTDRTKPWCYESGSVTAGAALSSGVIDTRRAEALTVIVEATTTNRALVVSCTDAAGTSLFDFASLTVTAGSKFFRTFRIDAPVPGSEPTGVVHIPVELCRYMKASVAAAGAASAKLATYVR